MITTLSPSNWPSPKPTGSTWPLTPPQPGDLLAGRIHYPAVGFGLELAAVQAMLDFWQTEATIDGHLAEMGGRLSGTLLDFEKLTRIGLPGLRTEIAAGRKRNDGLPLYAAMHMALDLFVEAIRAYAAQTKGEMRAAQE